MSVTVDDQSNEESDRWRLAKCTSFEYQVHAVFVYKSSYLFDCKLDLVQNESGRTIYIDKSTDSVLFSVHVIFRSFLAVSPLTSLVKVFVVFHVFDQTNPLESGTVITNHRSFCLYEMDIIVIGRNPKVLFQERSHLARNLGINISIQSTKTHEVDLRTRHILSSPQYSLICDARNSYITRNKRVHHRESPFGLSELLS